MEQLELYELQALRQAQQAVAQAQTQLQTVSALITARHDLKDGDNINEMGVITRKVAD